MEVESLSVPGGVCAGCLSAGRRLEALEGDDLRYFEDIVHSGEAAWGGAALCWECAARLRAARRLAAVLRGARRAIQAIQRGQSTQLQSLSRLTCQVLTSHCVTPGDVTSSPAPLQFIKVEQDDDHYAEDNCADDYYDDVKSVLKSDAAQEPKERKRRKKRARARGTIEFDSSDDEPLTQKAKKKHTTQDGDEIPKKRRPRREQPAGEVTHARVPAALARLGVPPGAVALVRLSWDQVEAERQAVLSSARYSLSPQRCEQCALGFNHSDKLRKHMLKHDPSSGAEVCSACGVRCRDARALAAHRRRHRLRWRCSTCGALYSRAAVAADHVSRAHGTAHPLHACRRCDYTATSLGRLRAHGRRAHGGGARCPDCGKTFADSASLRTHLFIHRGSKEHVCGVCGKQFVFLRALQIHAATHRPSQALYCHQCDVTFKSASSYYQHVRYSLAHVPPSRRPHACPHCPRRCARAARLQEHVAAVHTNTTPIKCDQPECTYACASRAVLRAHIRVVHRGQRAARRHVCHRCGNQYTARKTLEAHLLSHAGLRPLRCTSCAATFTHRAALYNHTRLVHLKIKKGRGRGAACGPALLAAAPDEAPTDPPVAPAEDHGATTAPPPEAPVPPAQWLPVLTHKKSVT